MPIPSPSGQPERRLTRRDPQGSSRPTGSASRIATSARECPDRPFGRGAHRQDLRLRSPAAVWDSGLTSPARHRPVHAAHQMPSGLRDTSPAGHDPAPRRHAYYLLTANIWRRARLWRRTGSACSWKSRRSDPRLTPRRPARPAEVIEKCPARDPGPIPDATRCALAALLLPSCRVVLIAVDDVPARRGRLEEEVAVGVRSGHDVTWRRHGGVGRGIRAWAVSTQGRDDRQGRRRGFDRVSLQRSRPVVPGGGCRRGLLGSVQSSRFRSSPAADPTFPPAVTIVGAGGNALPPSMSGG
jgi:hypothetical protein